MGGMNDLDKQTGNEISILPWWEIIFDSPSEGKMYPFIFLTYQIIKTS